MITIETISELRALTGEWREAGDTIALVPTMGNLHKGHMSLVELAAASAEHVIVSVFVNPTQFGPGEDFQTYPRTLEVDARRLARAGVDVLFAPSVSEIYPRGLEDSVQVFVPGLSDQLCGEFRPGHFLGVTSVVCRLLNICMPDTAVFGEKDYQQLVILRRMVDDLRMSVQILAGATQRDANGLALSSRNTRLDEQELLTAAAIQAALQDVASALRAGGDEYLNLEKAAQEQIAQAGLEPEYVAIRDSHDLSLPQQGSRRLAVLAAAHIGDVRLIDNIVIDTSS